MPLPGRLTCPPRAGLARGWHSPRPARSPRTTLCDGREGPQSGRIPPVRAGRGRGREWRPPTPDETTNAPAHQRANAQCLLGGQQRGCAPCRLGGQPRRDGGATDRQTRDRPARGGHLHHHRRPSSPAAWERPAGALAGSSPVSGDHYQQAERGGGRCAAPAAPAPAPSLSIIVTTAPDTTPQRTQNRANLSRRSRYPCIKRKQFSRRDIPGAPAGA